MASVDFRRWGGEGNDCDDPTTGVVGGSVAIDGEIDPNHDLDFWSLGILEFWDYFVNFEKFRDFLCGNRLVSCSTATRYKVWSAVFLFLLMEAQVVRRLFESFYVFNYRHSARMHIFLYLCGICYYIAAPLSLCSTWAPEAFRFTLNLILLFTGEEGTKPMPVTIGVDEWESGNGVMKLGWYQWVGSAIFLWGWIHQLRCHANLGRVRAQDGKADDYVIPRGDWFEIVSSPHYLAEIVIYLGLVVASGGGDLTIWLPLGTVVANLLFAAAETHKWYIAKFEDYPSNRYVIIPFIF